MLKKSAWLACLLLCLPSHALAQSARSKADELKALGREAIIEMAEEEIKKRHEGFSRENFDRVKVLVNKKSVYASFTMPVRYVPLNSAAYYGLWFGLVDPDGGLRNYDTVSNPSEAAGSEKLRFFQPTEASSQAVSFVLAALEIDAEKLSDRETVTISEQESTFEVNVDSPETWSGYTVAKGTGEVLSQSHGHNAILPGGNGSKKFEELID